MTTRHITIKASLGLPPAEVIAWSLRGAPEPRWVEATMRRVEMPSVVDIAKRPDALARLQETLGL